MGATEKESLINTITIQFAEDFGLGIKDVKAVLQKILSNYHVTISDEKFSGESLTTEYLMNKFTSGKTASGMSEKTLKQYKIAVQVMEEKTQKRLSDAEPEDISNFLQMYRKEVSAVTVKAKYQLLSSVYNYLYTHSYLPSNPMTKVDTPKADFIVKNPLSDGQLEKIKKACEQLTGKESLRDMALIHFFTTTGCRVSELKKAKIGDVDFDKKICKVMGKGRKERYVVLNDKAIYRLNLYLESRKDREDTSPLFASIRGAEHEMTSDGIEHIIHKLRDNAGLEKLTCHVFRRYYATELRRRNVPIQMVATSLGHANLNQINRYSLFDTTEMQNVIRQAL